MILVKMSRHGFQKIKIVSCCSILFFQQLEQSHYRGRIAVIGSTLPIDWEDWWDSEIMQRTIFISTAEDSTEAFPQTGLNVVQSHVGVNRMVAELENPVKNVVVKGKGFMPIQFDITPWPRR